jgi:hypothetical protein
MKIGEKHEPLPNDPASPMMRGLLVSLLDINTILKFNVKQEDYFLRHEST